MTTAAVPAHHRRTVAWSVRLSHKQMRPASSLRPLGTRRAGPPRERGEEPAINPDARQPHHHRTPHRRMDEHGLERSLALRRAFDQSESPHKSTVDIATLVWARLRAPDTTNH